jgi:ABC-type polysaccharide/polyol phosphate export permease
MPGWYETVATWNPVTPILDAARSILLGHTDWGALGLGLSVLAALAAVTYGLAGRHYALATSAD